MSTSGVIDSSAAIELLHNERFGEFASRELYAPHLIDLEVANVMRKLILRKRIDPSVADRVVREWALNGVIRFDHGSLLERVWQLRETITPYDACYVALAERLQVALITSDKRLASAAQQFCDVQVLEQM